MALGNNIKKYRRDLGLTQEELAGILNVTGQAVSKWESGTGLPDITQVVPLAKALNVTTDALFGFNEEQYDAKLAEEVHRQANALANSGEAAQGALRSVEYLDQQCEENIFNYGIMTRYVQGIAHMSRFVNPNNAYSAGLLEDDGKKWKQMLRTAENRAQQVIRYSEDKKLTDECHYALAWICWHTNEWEKGRQHIAALPSVGSNMLQETLLPYYIRIDTEEGKEKWQAQVRDNYQNFIRALNKQIVYTAESMMWSRPLQEVEDNCRWGLAIMDQFTENEQMRAHCQGYYRDTYKFLIAAYLRNKEPKKAAEQWKKLLQKIDWYVAFCDQVNEKEPAEVVRIFGEKSARNMRSYTREWIDGILDFILGRLECWSDKEVFAEFKKQIGE